MQLVRYEAAKQAIAAYKTVDEVKDFRDKAVAIEAYAKQANDYELERDAAIARVRAERKCGELLRDREMAKGGNPQLVAHNDQLDQPKTLAEMGVTKDQSSKWQKLAAIPEEEFEEAITIPGTKPSTSSLVKPKEKNDSKKMDSDALWLWGRLIDWENGCSKKSLPFLVDEMTDAMRSDVDRIFPKFKTWVNAL